MKPHEVKGLVGIVGNQHVLDGTSLPVEELIYGVAIVNATYPPIVFDEIAVLYSRNDVPGVVIRSERLVMPGQTRTFPLVPCGVVSAFVVGLFWSDETGQPLWAQIPEQGNLYPPVGSVHPCYAFIELLGPAGGVG